MFGLFKRKEENYSDWRAVVAEGRPDLACLTFKHLKGYVFSAGNEIIKFNKAYLVRERRMYPAMDETRLHVECRSQAFFFKERLSVSEVTYADPQQRFFTMLEMPGECFKKAHSHLSGQQLARAAESIGSFIGQVAALGAKESFNRAGLEPLTRNEGFVQNFQDDDRFQSALKESPCLAEHFNDYAAALKTRPYTVIHGDLHNENIFVQRADLLPLSGVLDLGNISITKAPEAELSMAASCNFLERADEFYPLMTKACSESLPMVQPRDFIVYEFIKQAHAVLYVDDDPVGKVLTPRAEAALRALGGKRFTSF